MTALARMRWCPATRAYVHKRKTQGLSKREIIRCLKRHIARQTFRTIRQDLQALTTTP